MYMQTALQKRTTDTKTNQREVNSTNGIKSFVIHFHMKYKALEVSLLKLSVYL